MRLVAIFISIVLFATHAGCVAGGFTASLSDEELPVDGAHSPYPTAISNALPDQAHTVRDSQQAKATAEPRTVTNTAPQIAPTQAVIPAPLRLNSSADRVLSNTPHQVAKPPAARAGETPLATATPATSLPQPDDTLPPVASAAHLL